MGNLTGKIYPRMVIDKIIANDEHKIHVGVSGQVGKIDNPFKNQVIRIDEGDLKSLVSYSELKDGLEYEFEDNIKLKFMKKEDDIIYQLKTDNINYTSKMNDIIREHNYNKTISLNSKELDKIFKFIEK
jgi:hypothetical protein